MYINCKKRRTISIEIINNGTVKKKKKNSRVSSSTSSNSSNDCKIKQFKNKKKTAFFHVKGPNRKADRQCQRLNGLNHYRFYCSLL